MTAFVLLSLAASPALPMTGLAPARLVPNLCSYHYRVGTLSAECQKYCDQGLAYHASYVWMEAARSFETALKHDPDCAFAWLGLHKALEKWKKAPEKKADAALALTGGLMQPKLPPLPKEVALERARVLLPKTSHREGLLIKAKLLELGWLPSPEGEKIKKATAALDEMITLYDDDEEAWFARAQIAEAPIPFYKALLRINPLHPGANHELVHQFENGKRPALGWIHAEKYMESSPGIPHALHMQAHLATRIGKWQSTSDNSTKAIELERQYHAMYGVKPADDHQFQHHLETLTRSLVHDGRFTEAQALRKTITGTLTNYRPEWLRMATALENWADAQTILVEMRKTDKAAAAYHAALLALARGDAAKAKVELGALKAAKGKKSEVRLWEVEGRMLCLVGDGAAGLKLLRKAVDKTKDDYAHHAWGGGARIMESWGEAALECGEPAEAAEAFQEALAHDSGSVRGALGLWALCEQQGRSEEANRYLKLARKCWPRAASIDFERLKTAMAKRAADAAE